MLIAVNSFSMLILLAVFQTAFSFLLAVILIVCWFYWLSVLMTYHIVKKIFVQNLTINYNIRNLLQF